MTAAVQASVRREAPEMPNPIAPTDENLIAGGKLFSNGCAGCHGTFGSSEDTGDFEDVPKLLPPKKSAQRWTDMAQVPANTASNAASEAGPLPPH